MQKQLRNSTIEEIEKISSHSFDRKGLKTFCEYLKKRAGENRKYFYPWKERILELYEETKQLFPDNNSIYFSSDLFSVLEVEACLIIFGCIEREKTEMGYTITLLDKFFELCKELGVEV